MNHFILTRFNLRYWTEDKNRCPVQTEAWLEDRFTLFETFCLPSIQNQSCQNFRWICLFDNETPQKYKVRIADIEKKYPNFLPYYLDAEMTKEFLPFMKTCIRDNLYSDEQILITTYLDNDDALNYKYIEKVQSTLSPTTAREKYVVSFTYGLQYYEEYNIALRIPYKNNHFLSMVEFSFSDFSTIWSVSHYYVFESAYKIVCIETKKNPMWMEVIHAHNVDNDTKMTLKQKLICHLDMKNEFGIEKHIETKHSVQVFFTHFLKRFINQVWRRMKNHNNV